MNIERIIAALDAEIERNNCDYLLAPDANKVLARAGLLSDSATRPGKPLRNLLRENKLPHAFQTNGEKSQWRIPHSKKVKSAAAAGAIAGKPNEPQNTVVNESNPITIVNDTLELEKKIQEARNRYLPDNVRCVLIAEAPPESIERFFYYEDVRDHDHLFLGVMEVLYPEDKINYLSNHRDKKIKKQLLERFKNDGFFLLDLFDYPRSFNNKPLAQKVHELVIKLQNLAGDFPIIIIKASLFDEIHYQLSKSFKNISDIRIPFPSTGNQAKFRTQFANALVECGIEDAKIDKTE